MASSESRGHDGASSGKDSGNGEAEVSKTGEPHETVDPETRVEMLEEYGYKCQGCGRCGPGAGGVAELEIHHIEQDPDGIEYHDPENLTVLCRACHNWLHHRPTRADAPVSLTDAEVDVVAGPGIAILQYLAANGPATTGEIRSGVTVDLSSTSVREWLWVLMGLDNKMPGRDQQIVDKDRETGEWGLTEQIMTSARGHIPTTKGALLQRMEDEQVRRALERGVDRDYVCEAFDVTSRTTVHKEKRARAFEFPLDAVSNRGGRPTVE